jgi:hypothetical protein
MRFTGFKTKAICTFGIYVWVWHARVVGWLNEEFDAQIRGQETWRLLIPFYNCVVWWRYFGAIRDIEVRTLAAADFRRGGKPLSVGRAFFWSSLWFAAGPYTNRHLNALDAFRRGRDSQVAAPASPLLVAGD